jgi:hypothetical protein
MFDEFPVVTCALCARPVDRMVWDRHDDRNAFSLTVHCHGDTDTMEIGPRDILNLYGMKFREGTAFTTKRLAQAAGPDDAKDLAR